MNFVAKIKGTAGIVLLVISQLMSANAQKLEKRISTRVIGQTVAKKDVATLEKKWVVIFAARDLQALADLHTPDAKWLPPNAAPAMGKPAIKNLVGGIFSSLPKLRLEHPEADWTIDVSGDGRTAFVQGRYLIWFNGESGPASDEGKFVHILKKIGGRWLIAVDIFNSDKPAAKGN